MNSPIQAIKQSLMGGRFYALVFFFLYGIILLVGLLLITVHNRPQINLLGFEDLSRAGIHNQILPLLSASLLGYLSMRLANQLSVRTTNAFILGMGAQMVYQTFPNNLWFYWKSHPTVWWIFFISLFWVLEIDHESEESEGKIFWLNHITLFGMFWVDWLATFFLLIFFAWTSARNQNKLFIRRSLWKFTGIPFVIGGVILVAKFILNSKSVFSPIYESGNVFWHAYCEDGVRGLLLKSFPPQLPNWNGLMVLGVIAIIFVLFFVENNKNFIFQQVILISSMVGFLFSKIFFPVSFSELGIYDTFLAFPLFLGLFTLLPAWLESFNRYSGIFVLSSILLAFCVTFVQLRSYAILYPVVGPHFYNACLSEPFYH